MVFLSCLSLHKKMIRKGNDIDQRFFVRMNLLDNFYRFIDQLAFAIDFKLIFRDFANLSYFSFKQIRSFHWAKKSTNGDEGNTMIVIPYDSHTDFCSFIT